MARTRYLLPVNGWPKISATRFDAERPAGKPSPPCITPPFLLRSHSLRVFACEEAAVEMAKAMNGSQLEITEHDEAGKLTATYVCSAPDQSGSCRVDFIVGHKKWAFGSGHPKLTAWSLQRPPSRFGNGPWTSFSQQAIPIA